MVKQMRVDTVRKGKGWSFRVMRNRTAVHKDQRVFSTKGEAAAIGQSHKQAIKAGIDPRTGHTIRR